MPNCHHSSLFWFLVFITPFVICDPTWSTASLSASRYGLAATTVGTKAIFAGGVNATYALFTKVDIYDSMTNTWSTASLSVARCELAATTVGTKAIFAGGHANNWDELSAQVDIYDTMTNTWSTASLSVVRAGLVATTVGTKAIFAGGSLDDSVASAQVDIYDSMTNTWSTASLSAARYDLAATTVGSKAIFAGGYNGTFGTVASDQVDIYDSMTNTWSTASLSFARWFLAATTVGTKAIFAGGGYGNDVSTDQVDIYDSMTNTWSTASLSVARWFLAATTVGTKAIFAGGSTSSANAFQTSALSAQVDIYDSMTNTWSTASLSVARYDLAATTVGTKAIFAGGSISGDYAWDNDVASAQVDIYDNTTLTPIPLPMPSPIPIPFPTPTPIPISALTPISLLMPSPTPIPISALTPISLPMPSPTPIPISALTLISLPMPSPTPIPISTSLNAGTVAGIVCGVVVFLLTVVVIIFFWKKYGFFMFAIQLPPEISWSFEEAKLGGERHEDFKMKQLKPDSKEFNTAKNLFFKYLDGENIGVSKIFAVYPKRLLDAFITYEENLQKRLNTSPHLFQHQQWQDDDPDGLRQWVKDRFDIFTNSFPWNFNRTVKIIPQVHGTDFKTAMAICNTGFATLSLLDDGWYGKGIYFTSSGVYATPYFATKKKPTIIIAYVIPGNPYPVTEHPLKKKNLVRAALKGGAQSHYVITSIDGHPVEKPQAVCFDELVITQEAQVLPAFILVLDKSNLGKLLQKYQREVVESQKTKVESPTEGVVINM